MNYFRKKAVMTPYMFLQRKGGFFFEASLVYIVSFKLAKAT